MRVSAMMLVCACGNAPLHIALNIVTPIDSSAISDVTFTVTASTGAALATLVDAQKKGTFASVNFKRPYDQGTVTLNAVAVDGLGHVLGVGETMFAITQAQESTATLFISSPAAAAFTPHPYPTLHARFFAQAVSLPGGTVWLLGGNDQEHSPVAVTEAYDPLTLTFSDGPLLAQPCLLPSVATQKLAGHDLILVAGGHTVGGLACQSLQVIDATAGSIGPLLELPEPRDGAAVLPLADGRMALVGGRGAQDTETSAVILSISSTANVQFSSFSATDAGLQLAAPAAFPCLFAAGGVWFLASEALAIQQFNASTGAFSAIATFAIPRTGAPTLVAGLTSLYLLGGGAPEIERWLPGGTPTIVAKLDDGQGAPTALELPDSVLAVTGGDDAGGEPLSNALFYDFSKSTPTVTIRQLATPRAGHLMVRTVTNTLLVTGGSTAGPTAELLSLP